MPKQRRDDSTERFLLWLLFLIGGMFLGAMIAAAVGTGVLVEATRDRATPTEPTAPPASEQPIETATATGSPTNTPTKTHTPINTPTRTPTATPTDELPSLPPPAILGDVNCDGLLNNLDATVLLQFLDEGPKPECLQNADMNNDGEIDGEDAKLLLELASD